MGDKPNRETGAKIHSRAIARIFDFDYSPSSVAMRIAVIYMMMGSLWILLSDWLLDILISNKEAIIFASTIKGWVYVFATGYIIFILVLNPLKKIKASELRIKESFDELSAVHQERERSEEFSRMIISKMLNAYALHKIILDESGKPCDYEFIDVNPSFEEFTGLKKEAIVGKRYKDIIPKSEREKTNWVEIYGRVATTGIPETFESYTAAFEKWVSVNAYSPAEGYFITVFNDITDIKNSELELKAKNEELASLYEELTASEEELRQQYDNLQEYQEKLKFSAYHDPLTGLPNRLALFESLTEQIYGRPHERKALLFIDSDNFKLINDTMGHSFGDQLITSIGERLASLFENEHTVYRLGGDEFIIFCHGFNSPEDLTKCLDRIFDSFKNPFNIGSSSLYMTVSIGISTYPENGQSADELIRSADIAMYRAKALGKSKYVFFNDDMQAKFMERMVIERHLRSALNNREFLIYYQPQLDIKTGKITGFEALLRWNNPVLGFISPIKFIGIAEETHLIIPIGEWVLQSACSFIKELHSKGYTDLTVSVNVSILQLLQEDYADSVIKILESTGINPEYLEIEITESILMESYQMIQDKLSKLKQYGIKLALDDFGKGYSSLSYLKQLPINTLKIDKSFVDSIGSKNRDDSLTGFIVTIGRKMGLTILAEGVESQDQMEYLSRHQCHKIQGYLISKPVPKDDAVKLYETWNQDA